MMMYAILAVLVVGIGLATWKAPRLTSVIWWSLIATIFFCSALLLALPGDFSTIALWLTLFVPICWAVFQFWCYWDSSKWRVTLSLITITVVSIGVVVSIEPPV